MLFWKSHVIVFNYQIYLQRSHDYFQELNWIWKVTWLYLQLKYHPCSHISLFKVKMCCSESHVIVFNYQIHLQKSRDYFKRRMESWRSRHSTNGYNSILAVTWPYLRSKCCSEGQVTIVTIKRIVWKSRDYFQLSNSPTKVTWLFQASNRILKVTSLY